MLPAAFWGRGAGAARDGEQTGDGGELEQADRGICGRAQSLALTGDVAQSLCPRLHEEGTGMGTFLGGVAQTPQGCRGWLGALPVPAGWRCRGCPCHLILPPCKPGGRRWGHWPCNLGAWGATRRGVRLPQGAECLSPPMLLARGWTEHTDTKDASTHAGPRRETSLGHRAASPRHPGKGCLADVRRTTKASLGGRGTGFTLQTEA